MNTNTVETVTHSVMDVIWDAIGVNGQFLVCLVMFLVLGMVLLYVHDDFKPTNQGFWKWLGVQIWKDLWNSMTQSSTDKSDKENGEKSCE